MVKKRPRPRCVDCKVQLRPWKGIMKLSGLELPARGWRCSRCEHIEFDWEQAGELEAAKAEGLAERGVRTGVEFKFMRKMAGLSAQEFAEALDVAAETVSRWETGRSSLPRYAAFAVVALYEDPEWARDRLGKLAGN